MNLRARDKMLDLSEPVMMGILDVTPDLFSGDGGVSVDAAVAHGLRIADQGAAIIDVSGQSSRSAAKSLDVEDELARIVPVVERLVCETEVVISVGTQRPAVAKAALEAGAHVVNDTSGLNDSVMLDVVAKYDAGVIIMHMQNAPDAGYFDVAAKVAEFFGEKIKLAKAAGVGEDQLILDPGLGFGKNLEHNLDLLRAMPVFRRAFPQPLLVGASRKAFVGKLTGREAAEGRIFGTVALTALAVRDGVNIVRVHDVKANHDAIVIARAIGRDLR